MVVVVVMAGSLRVGCEEGLAQLSVVDFLKEGVKGDGSWEVIQSNRVSDHYYCPTTLGHPHRPHTHTTRFVSHYY